MPDPMVCDRKAVTGNPPENLGGDLLRGLNPSQRAAVTYEEEGPLLVLAGPGSGKTTVMIRRIRYLLTKKSIPPEQILAVTFTRGAAASMRERFLRENADLPQQSIQAVNFGTFHSVFYQILRQSGKISEKQILGEADKKKLMLSALSFAAPEIGREEHFYYCAELLTAVGYYKNTGDMERTLQKIPAAFQERFPRIAQEYEEERRRLRGMDYDDILLECRKVLSECSGVRACWNERFRHILIDEFQDINSVQYETVRLLSVPPYFVFAVGDDDQSIYGFRGARPDCMQRFVRDYHAGQILLDLNYRSCQEIVDGSLAVIGENKRRFSKKLRAENRFPGTVSVYGFWNRREQNAYLTKRCREEGDCAVLFRTNRMMQRFARILVREKIDFEMREKSQGRDAGGAAQDMMAYLRLGSGETDAELIARVINKPSRFVSREALGTLRGETGHKKEAFSALARYYREKSPEIAERIGCMERHLKKMQGMSPYLALQYVRRVIGYDGWVRERYKNLQKEREEIFEILDWLSEEAKEYESLSDWLEDQREFREKAGQKKETAPPCGIRLMTVHAAKGLEFERVILPDCNEGVYPHGTLLDEETVEEERRLFYVGMTRAKNRLELLHILGTKEHPMQMSRFLTPLLTRAEQRGAL